MQRLLPIFVILAAACACERGISLNGDRDGDSSTDDVADVSSDTPTDRPSDWVPDAGNGRLVPEGEPAYFEADSGESVSSFMGEWLPIAFSGEVYAIPMVEDSSWPGTDRVGIYRLAPGGTYLGTTWVDMVRAGTQPSICWSGEVFITSFTMSDEEGTMIVSIDEAGDLIRDPEYVPTDYGVWMNGDPKFILCPEISPMLVDIYHPGGEGTLDRLTTIERNGSVTTEVVELELPAPIPNAGLPAGTAFGTGGVLPTGMYPLSTPRVFFFDRSGSIRESSGLPNTADFNLGGNVIAVGDRVAVVWFDENSSEYTRQIGYALFNSDGSFAVPPVMTGIDVERDEGGFFGASSGREILVLGPPADGSEFSGYHLFLIDLMGNLLDDPIGLGAAMYSVRSAGVAWEGDGYGVIWNYGEGVMYQKFRVE